MCSNSTTSKHTLPTNQTLEVPMSIQCTLPQALYYLNSAYSHTYTAYPPNFNHLHLQYTGLYRFYRKIQVFVFRAPPYINPVSKAL